MNEYLALKVVASTVCFKGDDVSIRAHCLRFPTPSQNTPLSRALSFSSISQTIFSGEMGYKCSDCTTTQKAITMIKV